MYLIKTVIVCNTYIFFFPFFFFFKDQLVPLRPPRGVLAGPGGLGQVCPASGRASLTTGESSGLGNVGGAGAAGWQAWHGKPPPRAES